MGYKAPSPTLTTQPPNCLIWKLFHGEAPILAVQIRPDQFQHPLPNLRSIGNRRLQVGLSKLQMLRNRLEKRMQAAEEGAFAVPARGGSVGTRLVCEGSGTNPSLVCVLALWGTGSHNVDTFMAMDICIACLPCVISHDSYHHQGRRVSDRPMVFWLKFWIRRASDERRRALTSTVFVSEEKETSARGRLVGIARAVHRRSRLRVSFSCLV